MRRWRLLCAVGLLVGIVWLVPRMYTRWVVPLMRASSTPRCSSVVVLLSEGAGCARPLVASLLVFDRARRPGDKALLQEFPYRIHPDVLARFPVAERKQLRSDFFAAQELLTLGNGLLFAALPTTRRADKNATDFIAIRRLTQQIRFHPGGAALLVTHERSGLWGFPDEAIAQVSRMFDVRFMPEGAWPLWRVEKVVYSREGAWGEGFVE